MNDNIKAIYCKVIIIIALMLRIIQPAVYSSNLDLTVTLIAMLTYIRRDNFRLAFMNSLVIGVFSLEVIIKTHGFASIAQMFFPNMVMMFLFLFYKLLERFKVPMLIRSGATVFGASFFACILFLIIFHFCGIDMEMIKIISKGIIPMSSFSSIIVIIIPKVVDYYDKIKNKGGDNDV